MVEVKCYVSCDTNNEIIKRSKNLGISKSEYIRLLVNLDISIQHYQELVTYINLIHNKIIDMHEKLNIYSTPLQNLLKLT